MICFSPVVFPPERSPVSIHTSVSQPGTVVLHLHTAVTSQPRVFRDLTQAVKERQTPSLLELLASFQSDAEAVSR